MLFEDLRIELVGIDLIAPNIEAHYATDTQFDLAGHKLRRIYFLRRSIGTCREFAEALRLLNGTEAFQPILAEFSPVAQTNWVECVEYFKNSERFWKEIRNDIGGHFGEKAAQFAVENFLSDASGLIEIQWDERSQVGDCILGFSSEIAATGLLRHLPEATLEERTKNLFGRVAEAYGHAIIAVECLVLEHLWPRSES